MGDAKTQSEEFKNLGNAALTQGRVEEAVTFYNQAVNLAPDNHVLYSNRSAAYCKAGEYDKSLDDAEKVISMKPDWAKGYSRKGAALGYMDKHEEAMMAYMEGLKHDATNKQLQDGAKECKAKLTGPAGSQPMINPFAGGDIWKKLEDNPQTKEFLRDPEYRRIIEMLQKNPKDLGTYMHDPRVMSSLGVLLGVDLQVKDPDDMMDTEDSSMPGGMKDALHVGREGAEARAQEAAARQRTQQFKSKQMPTKPMPAEPDNNIPAHCKEALKEKDLGNEAYKKKDFEVAVQHYDKAIELDPPNITFRTNKAAVFFEQEKYDECIKECEKAIEVGREHRADYKLVAKAFARMGNAYNKLKEYRNAITFYNKSLSEFRDPVIVKKTVELEKTLKELERVAYINPELSLEEKKKGNEAFTKGDYPTAIHFYTEAIKRNPEDPKVFSNRSACYVKLAEFSMALRDADECIRLDPKFVKGYLRKAAALMVMKELPKAAAVYQKAIDIDPNCQEAVDGYRKAVMLENDPEAVKKQAMQDPEVQKILADPGMQLILQQMQKDPKAIQDHLKNPEVAQKIEKLMERGLIAFR